MKKKIDNSKSLGNRLKHIRLENGYHNQAHFAEAVNSNYRSVSLYETGRRVPSGKYLKKICTKFNVNPSWLLTGQGQMQGQGQQLSIFSIVNQPQPRVIEDNFF